MLFEGENHGGSLQVRQLIVWLDGQPVALRQGNIRRSDPYAGEVLYIHADHLGSPRAITRPTMDDEVVWRWRLEGSAFGQHAAESDPDGDGAALEFNLRYPGQYYDAVTGWHYNYFRDYESGTGRYIQSDPIGLAGGVSMFGYVLSSPLVIVDPKGLYGETTATSWCRQHPVECAMLFGGGGLVVTPAPRDLVLPRVGSGERCATCAEVYPEYDECSMISRYYPYSSAAHSLLDFPAGSRKRPGMPATGGVCEMKGTHHTVFLNGAYMGSIFSCRCCKTTGGGPVLEERWGNNRGR